MPSVDSRLSLRLELAEIPLIKHRAIRQGWLVHNRWTHHRVYAIEILLPVEKIGRPKKISSEIAYTTYRHHKGLVFDSQRKLIIASQSLKP